MIWVNIPKFSKNLFLRIPSFWSSYSNISTRILPHMPEERQAALSLKSRLYLQVSPPCPATSWTFCPAIFSAFETEHMRPHLHVAHRAAQRTSDWWIFGLSSGTLSIMPVSKLHMIETQLLVQGVSAHCSGWNYRMISFTRQKKMTLPSESWKGKFTLMLRCHHPRQQTTLPHIWAFNYLEFAISW